MLSFGDCNLRIDRAMNSPIKSAFLLLATLFGASFTAEAGDSYRTYRNPRFGTTLVYPANLIAPLPDSARGDGRKWVSRDGQIELTTYAFRNRAARTASGEMKRAISDWKRDRARLTYSRSGASYFVLSGYLGADIFYEKTLLRNGVFHTLIWQYPQILKKRLDAGVARSAASFSAGRVIKAPFSAPVQKSAPGPTPAPTAASIPVDRARIAPRKVAPRAASGY